VIQLFPSNRKNREHTKAVNWSFELLAGRRMKTAKSIKFHWHRFHKFPSLLISPERNSISWGASSPPSPLPIHEGDVNGIEFFLLFVHHRFLRWKEGEDEEEVKETNREIHSQCCYVDSQNHSERILHRQSQFKEMFLMFHSLRKRKQRTRTKLLGCLKSMCGTWRSCL